jgi:D-alanyl-D-alanine carboxypeptidase
LKRIVAIFIIALALLFPVTAFAQVTPFDESKATAGTVLLFNADTGQEIFTKNADAKIYPASTTKLMTALVAIENGILDDNVKVGEEVTAFTSDSSLMGLKAGETIPGRDLVYGMLLESGNDAAAATAVYIGGSVEEFANMMNMKALELGMTDTHFVNPHGIQDDNHYTTGADMKKLVEAAYQNKDLMEIAGTKIYTVQPTDLVTEPRELKNTNKLIYTNPEKPDDAQYYYEYATGMKTGYTVAANGCLVASASKDDLNLIALVFCDPSELGVNRWGMAKELFEYGFANYQNVSASDIMQGYSVNETISNPAENDPEAGVLTLTADLASGQVVMLSNDQVAELQNGTLNLSDQVNLTHSLTLTDTVRAGDEFGTVDFTLPDGTSLGTATLVASRDMYKLGDEKLQSQALGDSSIEFSSVVDTLGNNPAVLWWLLVPAGIIVLLLLRSMMATRQSSHYRRAAAPKYYYRRPTYRKLRYKGRYR